VPSAEKGGSISPLDGPSKAGKAPERQPSAEEEHGVYFDRDEDDAG